MFFKKDKEFAEKGLGMLYLKKVDGSEDKDGTKTQLLVRAETNLGNILLNVLLNNQMNLVSEITVSSLYAFRILKFLVLQQEVQ